MAKKYTQTQIKETISSVLTRNQGWDLYNHPLIRAKGETPHADGKIPYTEIIARLLLQDVNFKLFSRSLLSHKKEMSFQEGKGYYNANHAILTPEAFPKNPRREEEWIAKKLMGRTFRQFGKVFDYQVPLTRDSSNESKSGKIDLVSRKGNKIYLLELKRPGSTETLLRCILESYTYSQLINTQKFVADYGLGNAKDFTFIPSPLFFTDSQQHLEWQEMRNGNRPALDELSKNLNVGFFVLQNEIEEP